MRIKGERERERNNVRKKESKQADGKCAAAGPWSWRASYWLSRQRCKTRSCGCVSIVDDSPGNVLLLCVAYDWVSGSESLARAVRFLRRSISIEQRLRQVKKQDCVGVCIHKSEDSSVASLGLVHSQRESVACTNLKPARCLRPRWKEWIALSWNFVLPVLHKKAASYCPQNFLYFQYMDLVLSWNTVTLKKEL